MMSKNFLNYCKYSGAWIGFVVNPYHWRIKFEFGDQTELDPKINSMYIAFGPLTFRALLDDGSW